MPDLPVAELRQYVAVCKDCRMPVVLRVPWDPETGMDGNAYAEAFLLHWRYC